MPRQYSSFEDVPAESWSKAVKEYWRCKFSVVLGAGLEDKLAIATCRESREKAKQGKHQVALIAVGEGPSLRVQAWVRLEGTESATLDGISDVDYLLDRGHAAEPLLRRLQLDGLLGEQQTVQLENDRFKLITMGRESKPVFQAIPMEDMLTGATRVPLTSTRQGKVTCEQTFLHLAVRFSDEHHSGLTVILPQCVPYDENPRVFVSMDTEGCMHLRSWPERSGPWLGNSQWARLDSCDGHEVIPLVALKVFASIAKREKYSHTQ